MVMRHEEIRYLTRANGQPGMRATRVARAATRSRPGDGGRGEASTPASGRGESRN